MKINELKKLSEEKFIVPSIEVVLFDNADVVTSSGFPGPEDLFDEPAQTGL